jgi:hypothetical protein
MVATAAAELLGRGVRFQERGFPSGMTRTAMAPDIRLFQVN